MGVRDKVVEFSTTHVLPFMEAADEFVTEVVDAFVEAIPVDTSMHDDHTIEVHALSAFPGIGAVSSDQLSSELPSDVQMLSWTLRIPFDCVCVTSMQYAGRRIQVSSLCRHIFAVSQATFFDLECRSERDGLPAISHCAIVVH
eukprot:TRINITY_DN6418_c0_g1_i11.p1 TRINITY_DN6418_c0_g1~~TRINITY_DN6418_c0_g1_i11.p1  ORF type:complete len:143 (+),score=15.01 TRINITY_DN6418_c0_g1_i11:536-964(+)